MRAVPPVPSSRRLSTAGIVLATLLIALSCLAPPARASTASYSYLPMNLRAVVVASKQVGRPYVYGAAGPWTFDCSGLTQYAYARAGRRLPHSALGQYLSIRHIPLSQLRPGDLVFMNFSGGGPAGISHVGIYAGGGNWYVAKKPGTRVMVQHIWTHRGVYAGRP